jgi:hypothetical protein
MAATACDNAAETGPQAVPSHRPTNLSSPAGPSFDRTVDAGDTVEPGRHEVATFEPSFTFTIEGKKTWRAREENLRLIVLTPESSDRLVIARPDRVFTFEGGSPQLTGAPSDLTAWIESNPHLRIVARSDVTIGGIGGAALDVVVKSAAQDMAGCPIPCVPLFPIHAETPLFLAEGQKARFIVVSVEDEQLLIALASNPNDFDRFVGIAGKILNSVRFKN